MSGFVALLRTDGRPVDEALLGRLTAPLAGVGPDGTRTLAVGSVGMGHAHLAVGADGARAEAPRSLGGELWLTGDLRVDGRADLLERLAARVRCDLARASDAELVLHAYRAWGERCVEHLIGDFAFVLWDAPRRRLFCARDPFGVKLLYFAGVDRTLVLGNVLASVRVHPGVSDRLDDRAVGSYLLWGEHDDREATLFRDVRALPAGHTLSWSHERPTPRLERYWRLPEENTPVAYSDRRDVVDHFRTLLDAAVADRLGGDRASVFMSGGLDSPMVAASAARRLGPGSVGALTVVFDRILPDRERGFSTMAARRLGIPIRHFAADPLYTCWGWMRQVAAPEPQMVLPAATCERAYRVACENGRIVLTGYDGDSLLAHALAPLWRRRLRSGQLPSLARELAWHARNGRVPRLGIRAALGRRRMRMETTRRRGFPHWVRHDFARAQQLEARWVEGRAESIIEPTPRAQAYRAFETTAWRNLLDCMDPGMSSAPLEQRHPLLDVRLIRFGLSLPPVPWCVDKHLFREAMRGELPTELLARPKEPLRGDPIAAGLAAMQEDPTERLAPELAEYLDMEHLRGAFRALRSAPSAPMAFAVFNSCTLGGWLGGPMRRVTHTA